MVEDLHIFTDGGSRGNPGNAAIGVVVYAHDSNVIFEKSVYIGIATNNTAEYQAVVEALEWLVPYANEHGVKNIAFFSDSQLLVEQVCGRYKIKQQHIQQFYLKISRLREQLSTIGAATTFTHIPREKNTHADALVNAALDAQKIV